MLRGEYSGALMLDSLMSIPRDSYYELFQKLKLLQNGIIFINNYPLLDVKIAASPVSLRRTVLRLKRNCKAAASQKC